MTDGMAFTDLEEGLFGPDGTTVLRATAGRLIALRQDVSAQIVSGLPPEDSARSALAISAIDSAERILAHLKSSGDLNG
jgi:hypothetical protein